MTVKLKRFTVSLLHQAFMDHFFFTPFPCEKYLTDAHASVYRCEASNKVGDIGSRELHDRAREEY